MPVRNPAKAETKGRLTPLPIDPEPTTARGRRRSARTQEYLDNLQTRKQQTYGHRDRSSSTGGFGPFKGPSKRPSGKSNKDWKEYMCGRSSSL